MPWFSLSRAHGMTNAGFYPFDTQLTPQPQRVHVYRRSSISVVTHQCSSAGGHEGLCSIRPLKEVAVKFFSGVPRRIDLHLEPAMQCPIF